MEGIERILRGKAKAYVDIDAPDVERIERILRGKAKAYVDIDAPDEEGTAPLIYASCFVSPQMGAGKEDC